MTTAKSLTGFTPSRKKGGKPNSTSHTEYPIANAYAANIFKGDLVKLVAGKVQVIADTNDLFTGVFMGCRYVPEATGSAPVYSSRWVTGTSVVANTAFAFVSDDMDQLYTVQSDTSVTAGDIGTQNFTVTLGAGSAFTGRSGFGIKGSARTTGAGAARVVEFAQIPSNRSDIAAENAYAVVEVQLNNYQQKYNPVLTSIAAITSIQ